MAFAKRWDSSSSGDYSAAANWAVVSVRNSSYQWTASGSNSEYYLEAAGGGSPGLVATPSTVQINGSDALSGTVGSLASGRWGYGDNDTLGYSTIYVKIGSDPDSQALDYITFKQIPKTGDDVRIPAGTASISSGLDQSAVAIADFIVEDGYDGDIGTSSAYLRIDPDRFEFAATGGTAYIDMRAAAIACQVYSTGTPAQGERGLYLLGSAITLLNVAGGDVGIAVRHGETATVATIRLIDSRASIWIGEGCTITNYQQENGECRLRSGGTTTTLLIYDGTVYLEEAMDITTLNHKGGTVIPVGTGTIASYNLYAGTLDLQRSGSARTITTFNKYRGNWQVLRNKEAVTITTEVAQDSYAESATG